MRSRSVAPTDQVVMKPSFFQRHALLILMLVCFWVPFGMRGARMGAKEMRNDVKDWLPDTFEETKELAEFRRYFNSEAFVMVSWEGCHGNLGDERFRQFVDLFFPEVPPSQREAAAAAAAASGDADRPVINEELQLYARELMPQQAERDFVGNRFGFYFDGDFHENWAGLKEKWFRGNGGDWYYIVPTGDIYKWDEADTLVAGLFRSLRQTLLGSRGVRATLVAQPGDWDGPWYYQDPRRLEADLFKSVVTGPSLLTLLTRPGGAMEGNVEGSDEAVERRRVWPRRQANLYSGDIERSRPREHS